MAEKDSDEKVESVSHELEHPTGAFLFFLACYI